MTPCLSVPPAIDQVVIVETASITLRVSAATRVINGALISGGFSSLSPKSQSRRVIRDFARRLTRSNDRVSSNVGTGRDGHLGAGTSVRCRKLTLRLCGQGRACAAKEKRRTQCKVNGVHNRVESKTRSHQH